MTTTRTPRRLGTALAAVALSAAALTGCSSGDSGQKSDDGTPRVVASTNVYGDIASRVAGDKAHVESVISDPSADPHSFEASPEIAAKISSASLVVYNGAGYDEFVDKALATKKDAHTVVAVDEFHHATGVTVESHEHGGHEQGGEAHDHGDAHAGHDHAAGAPESDKTTDNEHVWFSVPTAIAVAEAVAAELGKIDPADAATYTANAKAFAADLDPVVKRLADLKSGAAAKKVTYVQTEPIGQHLFESAGLKDSTPAGFLTAIESDTDPSAADFDATIGLLRDRTVSFLAFNTQTETPVTEKIKDAATKAGTPVVSLTETLPQGKNYVSWMNSAVDETVRAAGR